MKKAYKIFLMCVVGLLFWMPLQAQKKDKLRLVEHKPGKWVIKNQRNLILYDVFFYDNGPDYPSDGLIRIVKNGKIGYANAKTYRMVIAPQFDCAFPFEEGRARVSYRCRTEALDEEHGVWESDEWLFIDGKGRVIR